MLRFSRSKDIIRSMFSLRVERYLGEQHELFVMVMVMAFRQLNFL